jgi:hypothetical protein
VTEWMAKNPQKIFKYAGEYIAIDNFKVIASGTSSVEVMHKVEKIDPTIKPLIMKVPPDGLSI